MKMSRGQFRQLIREFLEGETAEDLTVAGPHDDAGGGNARMAKQQLFDLARKAQSLHDKLSDGDTLCEWVQSEIAVAADKLGSVTEHLTYNLHRRDSDPLSEAFGDDVGLTTEFELAPLEEEPLEEKSDPTGCSCSAL